MMYDDNDDHDDDGDDENDDKFNDNDFVCDSIPISSSKGCTLTSAPAL